MKKLALTLSLFGIALYAHADTITANTTSGAPYSGVAYGQSVTTPDGGPWDTLGFNLINHDTSDPYALGGLYVLTQEYLGTPGALSSSTPGYLGFTDTINSGVWDFSNVTLNPDTQYFFYMDTAVPLGTAINLDGDVYAGGAAYGAGGGSFVTGAADLEFTLTGNQVAGAPEPGTLPLMAGAGAILALALSRKKSRSSRTL